MFLYSTLALCAGFLIDIVAGDPQDWPHIIRLIGALIERLEHLLYPMRNKRLGGTILVALTLLACSAVPAVLLYLAFVINPWLYFLLETLLCWQLLATKSLCNESNKVYLALKTNDLAAAKTAVSMIVGRDVESLDSHGVTRATVETIAENTSDGVVAPIFYIMLGGGALGCVYKAVNTMDSMIGYKNEHYLDFGKSAAKLDDLLNYIPSRLSAVIIISVAPLCHLNAKNAMSIWLRDRRKHASPNSAQTEAAVAGALGVRLAGDAYYFGVLHSKPYIGDGLRSVDPEDIRRCHKLLYYTAAVTLLLAVILRGVLLYVVI